MMHLFTQRGLYQLTSTLKPTTSVQKKTTGRLTNTLAGLMTKTKNVATVFSSRQQASPPANRHGAFKYLEPTSLANRLGDAIYRKEIIKAGINDTTYAIQLHEMSHCSIYSEIKDNYLKSKTSYFTSRQESLLADLSTESKGAYEAAIKKPSIADADNDVNKAIKRAFSQGKCAKNVDLTSFSAIDHAVTTWDPTLLIKARHDDNQQYNERANTADELTGAMRAAYHAGLCRRAEEQFLQDIGKITKAANLPGSESEGIHTPKGAGSLPYVADIIATLRNEPLAKDIPVVQLRHDIIRLIFKDVETLRRHISRQNLASPAVLEQLRKPLSDFDTQLGEVTKRYSEIPFPRFTTSQASYQPLKGE